MTSAEEWYRREAALISHKWDTRLDRFQLPCPLCRGELKFQGARRNPLYEFAEGEPGVVNPLHVLTISFVCNRCGFAAEFDGDLFNPAYLAQLQGAGPDRIAELTPRDFRVLVPLTGDEKSHTLLDLASALARERQGEVIVLSVASDTTKTEQLTEKLQHYTPAVGNPAPVRVLMQRTEDVGEAIVNVASRQRCELLLVGWRGWTRNQEAIMGTVLDPVLNEAICDVGIVHDRGTQKINRILLPTAGGPNARVAAHLAFDMARAFGAQLDLLYVAAPNDPDAEAKGQTQMTNTMHNVAIDPPVQVEKRVVFGADWVQTIVSESSNYDLMLIGAPARDWRGRIRPNSKVARIVRNASPTTILVSGRHSRLGSWLSRLFT